jgi:signal transduction histidine kinase
MMLPAGRGSGIRARTIDLVGVTALVVPVVVTVAITHLPGAGDTWIPLSCVASICAALLASRRNPLVGCLLVAAPLAVLGIWGPDDIVNAATAGTLAVIFVIAVRLGATKLWSCILGVGALYAGLQIDQVFNPLSLMLTIGPCGIGMVLASQSRLAKRLEDQSVEIAREKSKCAEQAVRYERARIARELHDIVAHCVSLIVVQAGAGQRVSGDPAAALDAFDNIAAAVAQAQTEIDLLVELLAVSSHDVTPRRAGLTLVAELVERARVTGMSVTFEMPGDPTGAPVEIGDFAYRVVQEGLTNALKHAPGASIAVSILDGPEHSWSITIGNTPGTGSLPASPLHTSGGGFGLQGMRERAVALGGELIHGPTQDGGWQLVATAPAPAVHR